MSIVDDQQSPEVDNQGRIVQAEPAPVEPEVPDKLKGKSMEEVYDMYLNAEKDRSRIANELGEQRKLTDKALSLSQPETAQVEEEVFSLDPTDLLADPVQTLDKYFERREAQIRNQYDSRIQQLESTIGQQTLAAKHPDAEQLTNDPEFLAWVAAQPVRQQLANQAVSNTDYSALDYLLSEYKGSTREAATAPPQVDQKQAARAASFEGSSSGESARSGGEIYSRNALIQMRIDNPEGYSDPAFQAEIMKAYAEGRVR